MRNRKPRSGWLLSLVLLVIVLSGTTLFTYAHERLAARWAFGIDGHAPLTGDWVGQLITATGRARVVHVELAIAEANSRSRSRVSQGAPHGTLEGTLHSCDEHGTIREYTVDGEPKDRDARSFSIHAKPVEKPPSQGLTFNWIQGRWDGADRLEMRPSFVWTRGTGAATGPDFPETQRDPELSMQRGGEAEFSVMCERIRGQRSPR